MSTTNENIAPKIVEYVEVAATSFMKRMPRFGQSDDFSLVATGKDADTSTYARGLIFIPIAILSVFLIWAITLVVCKVKSQNKSGSVCSGKAFPVKKNSTKPTTFRILFIAAGLVWIISTVLFYTKGVAQLSKATTQASRVTKNVTSIVQVAGTVATNLEGVIGRVAEFDDKVKTELDEFLSTIDQFIPIGNLRDIASDDTRRLIDLSGFGTTIINGITEIFNGTVSNTNIGGIVNDTIATITGAVGNTGLEGIVNDTVTTITETGNNIGTGISNTFSDLVAGLPPALQGVISSATDASNIVEFYDRIQSFAQAASEQLSSLSLEAIQTDVTRIREGIDQAERDIDSVDQILTKATISATQSLAILIPWILVVVLLIIGSLMGLCGMSSPAYDVFYRCFLLPGLIILTVLSLAAAGILSMASLANADFCSGRNETQPNPDDTIVAILEREGLEYGDILYDVVKHYLSQCAAANPLDLLDDYAIFFNEAEDEIIGFISTVQGLGLDTFDSIFQTDFSASLADFGALQTSFGEFLDDAQELTTILDCNNLSRLYTETSYSSVCTVSITSISWAWGAMTVIGLMGMIMLTLRSSCLGNVVIEEKKDDWDDDFDEESGDGDSDEEDSGVDDDSVDESDDEE